ncbi:cytochrome c family protein [Phaeobacter sp. B1627]|uniref:c-type cytochrome n=1 Tax=Phaeobacter sp. B1627 TaxID=2583809 RepID=UPI00111B4E5C|nr:cytochrome c family protein [Phaeobacter sp. B1627]TNJ47413.1 cytochrome c family protein [Phaeobacter sp. B1627]
MLKLKVGVFCMALVPAVAPMVAQAEGDAELGAKVFRKCKACHAVGDGAEHKVGPALNGVVGRVMAAADGFDYSDVLKDMAASGASWTEDELAAFLEKPRNYAKGTKMSFAGLRKEADRANVIAYLATFAE